jgi:PadR family transcriptional regulator AphA
VAEQGAAPRKLTTTAFAVLGLLSLRDWTTYELAQQMQRGVGNLWPAARSMVFEAPKQLVAAGLAAVRHEQIGRRPRAVYSITDEGRQALRGWLAEPGMPPSLAFEGILKLLVADAADARSALASLAEAQRWGAELQAIGRRMAADYLSGDGTFEHRAHIVALTFAFLFDFAVLVERWSEWAASQISAWPTDGPPQPPDLTSFSRALADRAATPTSPE